MNYPHGEALIATLLDGMTEFATGTVTRQKWAVLNSGRAAQYAVLRPGAFSLGADGLGLSAGAQWRTVVELWQRWLDDGATTVALQELTMKVIDRLQQYPTLGDTTGRVVWAFVTGGGEMLERWVTDRGPSWAVWEVYVDWREE